MLGPKAISSGSLPVSAPAAPRASATSAAVSRDVAKAPPSLAVPRSSWSRIASITTSGTCEPPGPSR